MTATLDLVRTLGAESRGLFYKSRNAFEIFLSILRARRLESRDRHFFCFFFYP